MLTRKSIKDSQQANPRSSSLFIPSEAVRTAALIPQLKAPQGSSHTVAVATTATTCLFQLKNMLRLSACAARGFGL